MGWLAFFFYKNTKNLLNFPFHYSQKDRTLIRCMLYVRNLYLFTHFCVVIPNCRKGNYVKI